MTECRFCFALTAGGEPTRKCEITGSGEVHFRWLCGSCANSLRHLGLKVSEVDE